MSDFDVIVVGGGSGNNVAAAAADAGLDTALVEPGPLGGTCLNRGCNPSKMLIQAANAANSVRDAAKFHVDATVNEIDQAAVIDEMDDLLGGIAEDMEARYREKEHLTLFKEYTEFVDERTLKLDGDAVTAEKVVVATGSRPIVPPIDGLDNIDYLTSQEALNLRETPESLVILGGGYIAVELGYALQSMGTDVTIVEMLDSLVPREDGDIAAAFTKVAAERHDVYTGHRVTAVEEHSEGYAVHAETEAGDKLTVEGSEVLVALGRQPNSDDLGLDAAGIEVTERGFIETNEYLETTAENVWAQGDVAGNALFKHSGDYETRHTVSNVVHGEHRAIDLSAMPHTIFTEPQIAGVGATEEDLQEEGTEYVVGRAAFAESAMGRAKKLEDGFMKVLAAPDGEILGSHAIGYEASTLLHEAVIAMRHGLSVADVAETIHAHPTLSKVVEAAFRDVPN
ncbi:dihydrolipoamide dehydrogenase [Halogeometricum borinquense DSM 11551]|uniref:Dihydrolipoamide dehydrogenase n=1 Tax=Halogeometricum borinquense (strain ATCC 700274 / DSM 11551 / JCM 10706 / KCTC 4070 / PR3) TaxID=469382 RepID=E4NUN6_HALBP|nr:dihydrolipoyl dehydrogenase [Halogeometricum borinquense]ADQ68756.1 pyruvate/2-oxoglutarate dehydrogenase complex, dihydrolipoamide dehydrogenase component [Halogeometricum borinquense DSM 11551]ELY25683.1 dihydrolipoamide dehydrogenase [Halogeometricum borinquense DSM 11551]